MVNNVRNDKLISTSLLLLTLTLPAQAKTDSAKAAHKSQTVSQAIEAAEDQGHQLKQQEMQPTTDIMSDFSDNTSLEMAQAYITDFRYDEAAPILEQLAHKYPEQPEVGLLQAQLWLKQGKVEPARLKLESLREKCKTDKYPEMAFRLLVAHVQSYLMTGESDYAYKLFKQADLKPMQLSPPARSRYQQLQNRLLFLTGTTSAAMEQVARQAEAHSLTDGNLPCRGEYSPKLARKSYQKAEAAYARGQYEHALSLALFAREMDPNPVAYTLLVTRANREVQQELGERFRRALPQIKMHIMNMRYALDLGDYQSLYREYLRFKADEDIAVIMKPAYRDYLPSQMYDVVLEVERTLHREGFNI